MAGDQAFGPHAQGFPLLQGPGAHLVADGPRILGHPAFNEAFAKIARGLLHETAARPKQAVHGERLVDGLADHVVGLLVRPARLVEGRTHHGRQIAIEILGGLGDHFRRIIIRGVPLGKCQEQASLEGGPGFGELLVASRWLARVITCREHLTGRIVVELGQGGICVGDRGRPLIIAVGGGQQQHRHDLGVRKILFPQKLPQHIGGVDEHAAAGGASQAGNDIDARRFGPQTQIGLGGHFVERVLGGAVFQFTFQAPRDEAKVVDKSQTAEGRRPAPVCWRGMRKSILGLSQLSGAVLPSRGLR